MIIGKLIPAATGLKRYRTIEIEPAEPLPRGIDDVGLLEGDDLAAELGLDDGEGLQGFGPAFDTAELEEIGSGFGTTGGGFDDLGDLGDVGRGSDDDKKERWASGTGGGRRCGRPRRLGGWIEPRRLVVRARSSTLPHWPAALDGLRAGVSPTSTPGMPHAGPTRVGRAVEALAAERPDVVCLLGDYIDAGRIFARPRRRPSARRAARAAAARRAALRRARQPRLVRGRRRIWRALEARASTVLEDSRASAGDGGCGSPALGDYRVRGAGVGRALARCRRTRRCCCSPTTPTCSRASRRGSPDARRATPTAARSAIPLLRRPFVPSYYGERYLARPRRRARAPPLRDHRRRHQRPAGALPAPTRGRHA